LPATNTRCAKRQPIGRSGSARKAKRFPASWSLHRPTSRACRNIPRCSPGPPTWRFRRAPSRSCRRRTVTRLACWIRPSMRRPRIKDQAMKHRLALLICLAGGSIMATSDSLTAATPRPGAMDETKSVSPLFMDAATWSN